MCMATLLTSINEIDKKVSHVVKATAESTLGQLGTVGAMAIEDFVDRLGVPETAAVKPGKNLIRSHDGI